MVLMFASVCGCLLGSAIISFLPDSEANILEHIILRDTGISLWKDLLKKKERQLPHEISDVFSSDNVSALQEVEAFAHKLEV